MSVSAVMTDVTGGKKRNMGSRHFAGAPRVGEYVTASGSRGVHKYEVVLVDYGAEMPKGYNACHVWLVDRGTLSEWEAIERRRFSRI